MKESEVIINELDTMNTAINKKIRKVIEEIIVQYEEEFKNKFSEEEISDVLKHKTQVGKLGVEDNQLEELIKKEVEDCIGAYLVRKSIKKK